MRQSQPFPHDALPQDSFPFASVPTRSVVIVVAGITGINQAAEPVPLVAVRENARIPRRIHDEQGIPFGGNAHAPELAPFAGDRVEVRYLDLEDAARPHHAVVRVDWGKPTHDAVHLHPRQRLDGFPAYQHRVGPPGQGNSPPTSGVTMPWSRCHPSLKCH
ncbi:MAG: Mu transposase C-terminal domain-containing protein [Chloroflexota bacterium]|nr:Mu transposase C-terminal domain-containing protein [Chloroflexota bacterium]